MYAHHEKYGLADEVAWFYFTGQRTDDESGLMYYGARYYDPDIGRFITPDSVIPGFDNPQAFNRYSYALNNPVNRIDPSGHFSWKKFWKAAVGAIVGVAAAIVAGPAGIGLGLTMAGVIGGAVGGAVTGGLNGGWQGALTGAALGGALGGIGGWAIGGGHSFVLGGMFLAGTAYAGVTDSWDSYAGGFVGGIAGAAVGKGIVNAYSEQFSNLRAGNGFVSDRTAAFNKYEAKIKALHSLNVNQKNATVERISRPLGKDQFGNPGSTTGPRHNAILSKDLPYGKFEMGPENRIIQTTNTVSNLQGWGTHQTTESSLALGGRYIESFQVGVNKQGLMDAITLYEQTIAGRFEYNALNHNSNFAVNSVLYGAGADIPQGGNAVGRAPGFPDLP
jgi:RHS repeat-associated protein